MEVGQRIKDRTGFDTKVTILGHLQRGGSPSAADRLLASRLGAKSVELLMAGETRKIAGIKAGQVVAVDIDEALNAPRSVDLALYDLAGVLSI
jgi:6-phosphofructokinase 1